MDKVVENTLPMLSDNAQKIVKERYLCAGEKDWGDVCQRVSRFIATADVLYTKDVEKIKETERSLYNDLFQRWFIFNSPTLFNSGLGVEPELLYKPVEEMTLDDYQKIYNQRNERNMLPACFYLTVENSIHDIYETLQRAALITKAGGGIGFSFSALSHKGRPLDSGVGVASGPLSFIKLFNESGKAVSQGGRRRGAFLATLDVTHPDIEEFIHAKDTDGELSYFNISVLVTDEFMRAVKENQPWSLLDPVTKVEVRRLESARNLWQQIVHSAWLRGDPGLLFFDAINRDAFITGEDIIGTNPCGEQPLYDKTSCNLGHINLKAFAEDFKVKNSVNFALLIHRSIHYLDNVIDMCWYPIPEITRAVKDYRPIGLGIMGFAHLLFKLGIKYGSQQCLDLIGSIGFRFMIYSILGSSFLARERGSYPKFDEDQRWLNKSTVKRIPLQWDFVLEHCIQHGVRNATVNTIAPTGTCSLIADTSSGLEPVFALTHERKFIDAQGKEQTMLVVDPLYKKAVDDGRNLDCFVDASMVSVEERIAVQSAWQKYIDTGISSTVNLPHEATEEDISKAYMLAWETGCKGVTVFRDGCKGNQVLTRTTKKGGQTQPTVLIQPAPRPKRAYGVTTETKVACGGLYITVNKDEKGSLIETFLSTSKGGGCRANSEGLSRMISLALRSGIDPKEVIHQLKGIKCPICQNRKDVEALSCPDAAAVALREALKESSAKTEPDRGPAKKLCPDCGAELANSEGCILCPNCGWSKCG